MKYTKLLFSYLLIFLFLSQMYDEKTMQMMYFHYPLFDFRYFIFIALMFFWNTVLFHIFYQYICLYPFMRYRLHSFSCLWILLKQFIIYCLVYIIIHILLFLSLSHHIPLSYMFINLFIQILGFSSMILLRMNWDYSYIFLSSFILIAHLFF